MKRLHEIPVKIYREGLNGKKAVIRHTPQGFTAYVGLEIVALSESAKRLAQWAWANGASEVKHDYNLVLDEDGR